MPFHGKDFITRILIFHVFPVLFDEFFDDCSAVPWWRVLEWGGFLKGEEDEFLGYFCAFGLCGDGDVRYRFCFIGLWDGDGRGEEERGREGKGGEKRSGEEWRVVERSGEEWRGVEKHCDCWLKRKKNSISVRDIGNRNETLSIRHERREEQ